MRIRRRSLLLVQRTKLAGLFDYYRITLNNRRYPASQFLCLDGGKNFYTRFSSVQADCRAFDPVNSHQLVCSFTEHLFNSSCRHTVTFAEADTGFAPAADVAKSAQMTKSQAESQYIPYRLSLPVDAHSEDSKNVINWIRDRHSLAAGKQKTYRFAVIFALLLHYHQRAGVAARAK